jgi:hypothetical protein
MTQVTCKYDAPSQNLQPFEIPNFIKGYSWRVRFVTYLLSNFVKLLKYQWRRLRFYSDYRDYGSQPRHRVCSGGRGDTFPFQKYRTIEAELSHVSPETQKGQKIGLAYKVKLRPKRLTIRVRDKDIPISSGMAMPAEIKTGEGGYVDESLTVGLTWSYRFV